MEGPWHRSNADSRSPAGDFRGWGPIGATTMVRKGRRIPRQRSLRARHLPPGFGGLNTKRHHFTAGKTRLGKNSTRAGDERLRSVLGGGEQTWP